MVDVGGQRLNVEDTGGDGPPLVLSHGFLMDHAMFASQVDNLRDVYRVITWDQRGAGSTESDGRDFTLWDSARDLFGILDQLGIERAVLVGAGQGGHVSLRAALLSPDRVRALTLIGGQAAAEPDASSDRYRGAVDTWVEQGYHDGAAAALADRLIGERGPNVELLDRWRGLDTADVQRTATALLDRDDLSDRIEELAMPMLLIHGTADEAVPLDHAYGICADASDCRGVVEVPGAGHACSLTHPEVVTPAIREFLEGLPA